MLYVAGIFGYTVQLTAKENLKLSNVQVVAEKSLTKRMSIYII